MSFSSNSSSSDDSEYSGLSNISDLDSNETTSLQDEGGLSDDDLGPENDLSTEVRRDVEISKNAGALNVTGDSDSKKPKKTILAHFVNQNNMTDTKLLLKAATERGCVYMKK
jgi:hypothetical protein